MGTRAAVYSPAESEITFLVMPRSGFDTITLAAGTTAPDWSVTVPTMLARSCAMAPKDARKINANAIAANFFTGKLLSRSHTSMGNGPSAYRGRSTCRTCEKPVVSVTLGPKWVYHDFLFLCHKTMTPVRLDALPGDRFGNPSMHGGQRTSLVLASTIPNLYVSAEAEEYLARHASLFRRGRRLGLEISK